jgi:uncharacterized damage-inducible protein DinB
MSEEELRYPIGRFEKPGALDEAGRRQRMREIEAAPERLRAAIAGLTAEQLDTPYRDGGWTVRQVVHHLPDSHVNAYVRMKLALTEEAPAIKPYDEARWAELSDSRTTPVETSLAMLEALHDRWMHLLRGMSAAAFARQVRHPEMGAMTVDDLLTMYAWHGRHHVAQVRALRQRKGW